jgi:hypothetical protein
LICEVIFEEIANPAASSAAELMRRPVESLSMDWLIARSFFVKAFAVNVALIFVLITGIYLILF